MTSPPRTPWGNRSSTPLRPDGPTIHIVSRQSSTDDRSPPDGDSLQAPCAQPPENGVRQTRAWLLGPRTCGSVRFSHRGTRHFRFRTNPVAPALPPVAEIAPVAESGARVRLFESAWMRTQRKGAYLPVSLPAAVVSASAASLTPKGSRRPRQPLSAWEPRSDRDCRVGGRAALIRGRRRALAVIEWTSQFAMGPWPWVGEFAGRRRTGGGWEATTRRTEVVPRAGGAYARGWSAV